MKLRIKIPLSIITFIVIFGCLIIIIGNSVLKNIIEHQIYNQLESIAKARAVHIETYLHAEKNIVLNLSESVVIEKLLELNKKDKNYNDKLKDVITRLKNTKKINEDIYEIFIADTTGVIVAANIEERIGLDRSDALYFINGKKGVYIKDPHYSRYIKSQPSLAFSAPIYQDITNILLGVVIIRIKLDHLHKITTDVTGLGETGEIFLLNKDLYMMSPSRFIKDTFLKQKVDTPESRECWKISGEKEEIERKEVDSYKDYRGKIVIGTHYKIEGIDWCLMSEINRKEAFAPITQLTIITILFFAIILVLCLIVSVLISKIIINPIVKMHRGSEEIIKGNLDYKIGVKQKDEIGGLSQAFDEMTLNLKKSKEKIEKYSEHLEKLVEQRTNELQISNKELEAFAYSVSHDLRAPLRHIYGFSELLGKRISNTLDEKSLKQLRNITEAAEQMRKLIDDLLAFSRIGRAEMNKSVFDFKHIIKKIQQEMELGIKGRKVIWKIGQFPKVYGDPSLLQQVLVNLVSNAVKFTSKRKEAKIEIDSQNKEKEYIFYVRDNGAGFDMRYKEKLFKVFQRLHSKDEFEGIGIGLANVHRIISKHGGRVWAESTLGEGATFYFSLPKK
ncbi:MAG: HAMP domain-containing protein [Candidatus Marinimicrobia bacterium]|nr:HAMP domain-containing protein [Candidatus Neomarinimicrobiota bacterium]